MGEEICRLNVLIEEFHSDFQPSPHVLKLYKSVSLIFVTPKTATTDTGLLSMAASP